MKTKHWSFWLGCLSVALMAADALMAIWQPILPPGIFAGLATVIGIGAKVSAYAVDEEKVDPANDGTNK